MLFSAIANRVYENFSWVAGGWELCGGIKVLLADMLDVVLLECCVIHAEDLGISLGERTCLEFDVSELKCAYAIRNLEETVMFGIRHVIEHGIFR